MCKTVFEIRMEKLQNWKIEERNIRAAARKAWWRCGISFGTGLLLYPVLCKHDLWGIWGTVFTICGLVFVYGVAEILQLEGRQKQHIIELNLLNEMDRRNV